MFYKYKKFFAILLLIGFFGQMFTNSTPSYAAVNSEYDTEGSGVAADLESETDGDGGGLMSLLATFVLTIAALIQALTSWCVSLIAKSADPEFPWADKIIFNAEPILDVNFINPANGSLMMKPDGSDFTTIGKVIRNVYFTGLSIGLGFMGIVIAILAIKLAISSIGSKKAQYKEAIVSWATALVLLFGMHYLLSFVFFINEQLVEVASKIVKDSASEANISIGGDSVDETGAVVSSLGDYFLAQANVDKKDGGILTSIANAFRTKPVPATLYLILVIQSVMFLFAYFKRFFYVVMLGLISPYVVIYDFLSKSLSM